MRYWAARFLALMANPIPSERCTVRDKIKNPSAQVAAMQESTMYGKIWRSHLVREAAGEPSLIYIDRHLIHEVTSAQAFAGLEAAGRKVRRPDLTFAVMDHSIPTHNRELPIVDQEARCQVEALAA